MLLALIGPVELLILLLGSLTVVLFPVLALISILRNEFKGNDKLVWVLVVIFVPIMGSILYFLMGRPNKLPG